MPSSNPYQALLLDLDGTVIDTHEMIYACLQQILEEHAGLRSSRELLTRCAGVPLGEVIAAQLEAHGVDGRDTDFLVAAYRARLVEMDDWVRPYPGIPETLAELRSRGVRLAIVTTKYGPMARRHLEVAGLAPLFEVVISSEICARPKPHPEPFTRALQALGVPPSVAAGVGDSRVDVLGARAAGLRSAAALWGALDRTALRETEPDLLLEAPEDLLRLLD